MCPFKTGGGKNRLQGWNFRMCAYGLPDQIDGVKQFCDADAMHRPYSLLLCIITGYIENNTTFKTEVISLCSQL